MLFKRNYIKNVGEFCDGLAPFQSNENGLWGYIDEKRRIVIKPKYKFVSEFRYEVAFVNDGRDTFTIDKNGNRIEESNFKLKLSHYKVSDVLQFSEGIAAFKTKEGKWGFIEKDGTVLVIPIFDFVSPFENGYAYAKYNNRIEIIDKYGNQVYLSDENDSMVGFSENMFLFKDSTGKYYYVNSKGKKIQKYFQKASEFKEGYAIVRCDIDEYYYMNEYGELLNCADRPLSLFSNGFAIQGAVNREFYVNDNAYPSLTGKDVSKKTNVNYNPLDTTSYVYSYDKGFYYAEDFKISEYGVVNAIVVTTTDCIFKYVSVINKYGYIIIGPYDYDRYEILRLDNDNFIVKNKETNNLGLFNVNGQQLAISYKSIELLNNGMYILDNELYNCYKKRLEINSLIKNIYIGDENYTVVQLKNGKYAYIKPDFEKNQKIKKTYDYIEFFKNGIAIVGEYKEDTESNQPYKYMEYSIIDENLNTICTFDPYKYGEFKHINKYDCGYLLAKSVNDTYYMFDTTGKLLREFTAANVDENNHGFIVYTDEEGKMGLISRYGADVFDCLYDEIEVIDENIVKIRGRYNIDSNDYDFESICILNNDYRVIERVETYLNQDINKVLRPIFNKDN